MTYDDAIRSVQECSYTSASEADLREMLRACMDIHGNNPTAHHRCTHAAEIIRQELQSRFLSGERTWLALQKCVVELERVAPKDHDVLITVDDVVVLEAYFLQPHSFLFKGVNQSGHQTGMVVHFSQLDARVVYLPKRGPARVITGFAGGQVS